MKFASTILTVLTIVMAQPTLAAPSSLIRQATHNTETVTLRLTKENLRGANFELWAQNSTGAYDVIAPVAERSYIGSVDEYPGAVSYGILQDNGVFKGGVIFDRGGTWYILDQTVTSADWLTQPSSFGFTWDTVAAGQGGSTVYGFDVGIDARYEYFAERGGGSLAKTLEVIEYAVTQNRALYLHDALLRPFLARVIIRADAAQDPAKGLTGGTYLDALKNHWNSGQKSANRDVVAGITTSHVWAGLAWVNVIASDLAYSVNDSQGDGNFNKVWQHEMGHNWGLSHYDGGAPEKGTINSDNHYARMSGPELRKVLNQRNAKLWALDNLGSMTTVNIPPYASYDSRSFTQVVDSEIIIDVLANDHDANGHALSLIAVDSTTVKGGTAHIQGEQVVYTPRGDFLGVDSFTYKIMDSSGQTATGAVAVDVTLGDRLRLYLPLDEIAGTFADDTSIFNRNGTLYGTDFATATVAGAHGSAVNLDGVDDHVRADGITLRSNTVTLAAWIKPGATQSAYTGIIFDRTSSATGLNFGSAGELRYHWNDSQYTWNSGLVPVTNKWTFVALVVEPSKATIYMNDGSGFRTAINRVTHAPASFVSVYIGRDPSDASRHFRGAIDEARVYGTALSKAELQAILEGGAAEGPQPFDGASEVGPVDLAWAPSAAAVRYHVYLGTEESAVRNATTESAEYQGAVTSRRFANPATTLLATNYWRVDVETASGTITGPVWSFTRNNLENIIIANHSFEDGPAGVGVPVGWTLRGGSGSNLGNGNGGSHGSRFLYIGTGVRISQDLVHTLTSGETLTLQYESSRDYQRNIQLLAKNGDTYQIMAETTATIGAGGWPTITLTYTVDSQFAGQQLAIRIISGNWNEFDNFRLTRVADISTPPNNPPAWISMPVVAVDAAENAPYAATLANEATDADGEALTFSKISGPAWLSIASDGTLIGTPTTDDIGSNTFTVRVSDPAGGENDTNLNIEVRPAYLLYDINGQTSGSGAVADGPWDGTAQWTSDPNGSTATFNWIDGAIAVFSTGDDAAGDYIITNSATRPIGGFIARSGRPFITGGTLQTSAPATPFNVEATALGAQIESAISGDGGLVKSGPGTLVLGGSNTYTGDLTVISGKLIAAALSNSNNSSLGAKDPARTITINAPGSMEWAINNVFGGIGMTAAELPSLALTGSTLEIKRFNVIGHTTLDGGTLINANSNAADRVNYDGFQFIGTVTAAGAAPSSIVTITDRGNHLLGAASTEFSVSETGCLLTIATVLRDGSDDYPGIASLRKTGPGTLALSAASLYTGTTSVEAGTLVLSGSITSPTTVAAAATLTGSGTVAAALAVQSGGTLAPDAAATLGSAALTLEPGSILRLDPMDTTHGNVAVTGNVELSDSLLQVIAIPASDPSVIMRFSGTRSGAFNEEASTLPAGWQIVYDDPAGEVRLASIPETYATWIAGYATNGLSGFNDDADADQISNGLEFLLGGDPTIANDTPLPSFAVAAAGGFTYSFTRAARARTATSVIAQLSDDLLTWPPARNIVIGIDTASPADGVTITDEGDHDTITILIPHGAPQTFIRLAVGTN